MKIHLIIITVLSVCLSPSFIIAKDIFVPAIQVDEMVITKYELDQRKLFFKLLNFPGDHEKQAKKTLIDDRLKKKAARNLGIKIDQEALQLEMKIFAERANLTTNQFIDQLKLAGVDKSTWVDYLTVPILWFNTVSKKFSSEISFSHSSNSRNIFENNGTEVQVLLTEIIVPSNTGLKETATEIVEAIRKIRSVEKFSEAAYRYSAAPTKTVGGKITWQSISNLPASVKPLVSGLSIGEVTEPLSIPGGIALFQLRNIREVKGSTSKDEIIDFLVFEFEKNPKIETSIKSKVYGCEDLFFFSKKLKKSEINRTKAKIKSLSKSLKLVLSKLDENEFAFIRENDQRTQLIMVCKRQKEIKLSNNKIKDFDSANNNKRLLNLANSYIENLRHKAQIVYK
jgi:peptidyl-prolyl cis-trans isomerase SurA